MQQFCRVQVLYGLGYLINDELLVLVLEDALPNETMKIDLHELEDEVDVFVVFGFDDVQQLDNVLVLELLEEHDLPVCTLGVCGVLEGVKYLLERNDSLGFPINGLPDVPVGPGAQLPDEFVSFEDVRLYLLGHR